MRRAVKAATSRAIHFIAVAISVVIVWYLSIIADAAREEQRGAEEIRQRAAEPASNWFAVHSIHVYDAWEGETPYMDVNRDIRRPFHGEWLTTVRNVSDHSLASVCLAEGRASYATDAKIKPDLTMDWWTGPTKCRMPPGRYRLDTQWRIYAEGDPIKIVSARSNVFTIHPHFQSDYWRHIDR